MFVLKVLLFSWPVLVQKDLYFFTEQQIKSLQRDFSLHFIQTDTTGASHDWMNCIWHLIFNELSSSNMNINTKILRWKDIRPILSCYGVFLRLPADGLLLEVLWCIWLYSNFCLHKQIPHGCWITRTSFEERGLFVTTKQWLKKAMVINFGYLGVYLATYSVYNAINL